MKIFRVASMAIAFCVVSVSSSAAQRPDSGPPGVRRGGMMGPNLLEGITLNDTQQAQVRATREKYAPQRMEIVQMLRSTGMPPDSATQAKLGGITEAQTMEIRAILTPDQQKILDKNVVDERERMAKRMKPPAR